METGSEAVETEGTSKPPPLLGMIIRSHNGDGSIFPGRIGEGGKPKNPPFFVA